MHISNIRYRHLQLPLSKRYGDANGLKQHRTCLIVRIETKDGVVGWGETFAYRFNSLVCERAADLLRGRDAAHPRPLVEDVAKLDLALAGGIELALFDLLGKASGLSLSQLLGGAFRGKHPAYASLQNVTEDADVAGAAIAEAARAVEMGFKALKMKVGWHPVALDIEWVNAVIDSLPKDTPIALDANRAMDLATARRFIAGIRHPERIAWFEEPLSNASLAAYRELRATIDVPVAGAESMPAATIEQAVTSRSMDIINPDLVGHGGFDRLRRLWALADSHGVRLVPHIFDGQLVRIGTLHFLATTPDWIERQAGFRATPVEYDISHNALRDELLTEPLTLDEDGQVTVPSGPGLGVEINEDLLQRYTILEC